MASNRRTARSWLRWQRYEDRLIALSPYTVCSAGHLRAYNAWVRMQNRKADQRGVVQG